MKKNIFEKKSEFKCDRILKQVSVLLLYYTSMLSINMLNQHIFFETTAKNSILVHKKSKFDSIRDVNAQNLMSIF